MPNREKIIKVLECSANGALHCFDTFCYWHGTGNDCDRSQIMLDALALLKEQPEIVRCKDCKFFAKVDCWVDIGHGAKMLAGGDVPTCKKWGDGDCHTKEDGYCYLAERKADT